MQKINFQIVLFSFTTLPRAFKYLISRPRLYHLIILPVLINIILGIVLFSFIFTFFISNANELVQSLSLNETLLGLLTGVSNVILTIGSFLITWFLLSSFGVIIQAPFNSIIVEKILEENGIKSSIQYKGIRLVWYELSRAIKFEAAKLSLIIAVFLLTFVLNMIPIVGSVLYLAVNTLNVFILNLMDLLDPSYERIDLGTKAEIKNTIGNLPSLSGIGIVAYLVWNIPILNFILMPLLFTASTFIFVELYKVDKI